MPAVSPQAPAPNPAAAPLTSTSGTGAGKKGPRGQVILYATWCKGCRICVEFCPTKVLAMDAGEDHPRVVLPDKCTACHFCDTHCPDLAIVIRKLA
jgi:2-oxoglutarate ferredoxin oxidoreductase subunit delta